MPRSGRLNRQVYLYRKPTSTTDTGPYDHPLDPPVAWVSIEPLEPSIQDGTRIMPSRVTMRYHSGVTVDTHLVYGSRQLFVKGVQNIEDGNHTMVLFCEEVVP